VPEVRGCPRRSTGRVIVDGRFAEGKADRLPPLTADLVRRRVDVILAGSNVPSLARPAGHLTRLTALGQVLNAKRLEALKGAVPNGAERRLLRAARSGR
jgi:hypothetical protein